MTKECYCGIIRKLGLSVHEYYDLTDGQLLWLRQRVMKFLRTGKMPLEENDPPIVGGYTEGLVFPLMRAAGASTDTIREVDLGRQVFKFPFAEEYILYDVDDVEFFYNCKLYGYDFRNWDKLSMTTEVVWHFFKTGFFYNFEDKKADFPINRAVITSIMILDGASKKTIKKVLTGKYPYIFNKQLERTPNMTLFYYPQFEKGCQI